MRLPTHFRDLPGWLVTPVRCEFGGGGGSPQRPSAPPAPPPPPAKEATTTARTLLAKMQPRRGRASTILGGAPAVNEPGAAKTLGTPFN